MTNFYDKIEDFLLGDLPDEERVAFETALQSDAELAKAVAQQQTMMQRLDALRLRKKVQSVLEEDRIRPRGGIAKRVVWTIAVLLVLLAAAFWVFKPSPSLPKTEETNPESVPPKPEVPKEILAGKESVNPTQGSADSNKTNNAPKAQSAKLLAVAHRYHIEPGMSAIRDGSDKALTPLQKAQSAYKEQQYVQVLKLLSEDNFTAEDEEARMLRAGALFNTGQFAAAARDYEALKNSFQFKQEARWNNLQCQLALSNLPVARVMLREMLADPDYAFRAKALELKNILKF